MTPRNIPLDDFPRLDSRDVACALRLLELEIAGTLQLLATDETARRDPALLDDLTCVLTLRKVFQTRLLDLQADGEPSATTMSLGSVPPLARERYPQPVLPALA